MELNFTFASVLIIVYLYIPGYFFKRFFFIGKFTHQFTAGIFTERLITNIFWGCVIQAITLFFYGNFFGFSYDYDYIRKCYDDLTESGLPVLGYSTVVTLTFYECFALFIAVVCGILLHKIVRLLRLDVRFPVLRFNNNWHYTFKGDLINHLTSTGEKAKVQFTEIDCLTCNGIKSTLYSGLLSDYTLNKTGELESLTLKTPSRYSNSQRSFISIAGDCLVIPEKNITNINIRYSVVPKMKTIEIIDTIVFLIILLGLIFVLFYIPYKYSILKWGLIPPMISLIGGLFFALASYLFVTQKPNKWIRLFIGSVLISIIAFSNGISELHRDKIKEYLNQPKGNERDR